MKKVTITKEPKASGMMFHDGVFTDEKGKEFDFTLCEMYDSNSGSSSFEITFCDETPENSEEVENLIMDKFNEAEE